MRERERERVCYMLIWENDVVKFCMSIFIAKWHLYILNLIIWWWMSEWGTIGLRNWRWVELREWICFFCLSNFRIDFSIKLLWLWISHAWCINRLFCNELAIFMLVPNKSLSYVRHCRQVLTMSLCARPTVPAQVVMTSTMYVSIYGVDAGS